NDPRHVIARAERPFVLPKLVWEKTGNVPNVIFLEGAVVNKATRHSVDLTGYYGAADKYVGALRMTISLP
ncbi:MAG: hypothetical protein JO091_15130, partial [Acidobacteriaceae bacterium]|nr:hypothetical protein [Acidobacteriaceae bacterium]